MKYKGHTYDPSVRYFGPQGCWLTGLISSYPPGVEVEEVKELFNEQAFRHDVDYTGVRRKWWSGRLIDAFERSRADKAFYFRLEQGLWRLLQFETITQKQYDKAMNYVDLAYKLIRAGGWIFYKK